LYWAEIRACDEVVAHPIHDKNNASNNSSIVVAQAAPMGLFTAGV